MSERGKNWVNDVLDDASRTVAAMPEWMRRVLEIGRQRPQCCLYHRTGGRTVVYCREEEW